MITIALNKGRILDEVLPLLAQAGIRPVEDPRESRRLIFPTDRDDVQLIVVRGSDVPTCVEHGAADMGVTGKDTLLEHGGGGFYEPLDLGIARCRLMTAGPVDAPPPVPGARLRVATKFVNVARRFYAARGQQVDLIHLGGAMELAPLIGLADRIVDIVDTGRTLAANGLEPQETIAEISSRIIVNKASMKRRAATIEPILAALAQAVLARDAERRAGGGAGA
ncbi:MAG TPA: ATP phosphoribosyltransferase [Pseudomonadales bacterium]|nr:ATP phosphoribosyltransferase [Pseudomonadales bacterium]